MDFILLSDFVYNSLPFMLPDSKEISESDWYAIKIKDKKFQAVGDPTKLDFLLGKFRELVLK